MRLSNEVFRTVVAETPLVSIDLIVTDKEGRALLGMRLNRPAKNSWFVPGGRVLKEEALDKAFFRLTQEELGAGLARQDAAFMGVFEHFYEDSVFGVGGNAPRTHYVVLAYKLCLPTTEPYGFPLTQHTRFQWWVPQKAIESNKVHPYTKAYLEALVKEAR